MVDELPPKIDGEEILYRVIRRLPDELPPHPNALKQPDLKEVIRNTNYRGSGKPESGMSFLRARYFKTRQEVYDRVGGKLPKGLAQCEAKTLSSMGLKLFLNEPTERPDHISLRCPDCDMKKTPEVCKPTIKGQRCPFYDVDTFDLLQVLELVEIAQFRRNIS